MLEVSWSLAALSLAGVAAAWLDLRRRLIPNWLCAMTLLAGLATAMVAGGLPALGNHSLHMAIALVAGMALFHFGVFGGGDAKFYAAAAAWFPLAQAVMLLIAVVLCGLVLLVVWFGYRRIRALPVRKGGQHFEALPYGVAIGAGAVLAALF